MTSDQLYGDRARAESFGGIAAAYDRYRPTAPDELFDRLVALTPTGKAGPADVLDVACGTGKTAVALARRGLHVLGVEIDERMADVARGHGIDVEISPFETWADAGRRFDLITCTSGWHWIDPERGLRKAAELLRPGGWIARFWNYHRVDEETLAGFRAIYEQYAPGAHPHGGGRTADRRHRAEHDNFDTDPAFTGVERILYDWERSFTADEWTSLVATYSDHLGLPAPALAAVQQALRDRIDATGGVVHAQGETILLLSQRA